MDKYIIRGGRRLEGEVVISGAKNAAVAILPAIVLSEEPCVVDNVPDISDVRICLRILEHLGAKVEKLGKDCYRIDPTTINSFCVPYEYAKKMRASYYFLGALLGKFNKARVSMPGGCPLGDRPIDQHLMVFSDLGAKQDLSQGMVDLSAEKLKGHDISFNVITVGGTMNAILAAVKAEGQTVIENAAREPHVVDLANFLNSMGAQIMGAGTETIKIKGVEHLYGTNYTVIPDQIEAGTFMVAAAATRGDVLVKNIIPTHLKSIIEAMEKIGVDIEIFDDSLRVTAKKPFTKLDIKTAPHPRFPTDMQPQISTLLTLAEGVSKVTEAIWDNRFEYVKELRRMGADITVDGKVAVIQGTGKLSGAPVKACDLRAGAALIIAGLAATGVTEIEDIFHVERGYDCMEGKLRALGAEIEKCSFPDPVAAETEATA
ncbi:MAG: UDP-N-acetylglucosamine 1-carboxyvinyltransferase [Ruminococcus sp.]|nr:UDP-N-acetylglucosamine 1-carboxyvinyltransferase [Ruminococcus sp.]